MHHPNNIVVQVFYLMLIDDEVSSMVLVVTALKKGELWVRHPAKM
jgi:hypothetical protein